MKEKYYLTIMTCVMCMGICGCQSQKDVGIDDITPPNILEELTGEVISMETVSSEVITTETITTDIISTEIVSAENVTTEIVSTEAVTEKPTEKPAEKPTEKATQASLGADISNVASWAAIEADVSLTGSGTGYHAKLVICTPTSAVSYGIQYDAYAAAPYTGKAMAMLENIGSNNPGGQAYQRPGNMELQLGNTYRMLLTLNRDGSGEVYLDNQKIGDFYNAALANQSLVFLRVEGSARKDGDAVNATFNNIRLKVDGNYNPGRKFGTYEFKQNPTITSSVYSVSSIAISGYISGLSESEDWDNRYNDVSGIIQFVQ